MSPIAFRGPVRSEFGVLSLDCGKVHFTRARLQTFAVGPPVSTPYTL
jgi:hypothetical protein